VIEYEQHRFLKGDITQGAVDALMGDERADVIYSDPAWGPGNQQYWHTMNDRGSVPRTSWGEFLAAFCRACAKFRKPNTPIFVEMGTRWADELDGAMSLIGLPRQRRWVVTYGPKRKPLPVTLNLYGAHDIGIVMPEPPHGEPVTRAVLSAVVKPGMVVLDPCTGLGMTARITHQLGGVFRGTELNEARLLRAIEGVKKGRRV
jgi:hypothetical protein